jgi:Tfp pilus assembly protein PilF
MGLLYHVRVGLGRGAVYLAIVLMAIGDDRRAEILLDEAEEIDPDLEFIQTVRQALKQTRPQKHTARKKKRHGR